MEYFKSGLKSVLGNSVSENYPSGADTVERLIDRLTSSTLLDDRRDACRALKALSKTYRVEVGAQGMDTLKAVLDTDKSDCEIIGLALDTLYNITSPEVFEGENCDGLKHNIGEQFTEILIKDQNIVSQILKFLEEFDFRVRWSALKLLSNLLTNKPKEIQEIILVSPMGVSKLMDMLSDSREVVRNDALLLLIQLTKGNANIQKIVAFENAFDRVFDVIVQEGGIEGGIIVEDCLLLVVNLLRGNYSNQNFFKEGSYIQKLTPMFNIYTDVKDNNLFVNWSPQKVSNVHCMLQVIRSLVAPSGPAQFVAACQNSMKKCGLLQALCDVLMISGVPADVLTETINTVAEVIRGNTCNQEFIANIMAPSNPPRSAMVLLLMSMVNEKQPFLLRCAVLYCFQCYLHKNEAKQLQLIQTLLPQGSDNVALTTGQLLCGGLFSSDALSNWFSAVALSHALIDNSVQKEQLLRVLLATTIGTPPITLIQQCVILLEQANKIQSKLGILILLSRWASFSPTVVKNFLLINSSVSYVIALLSTHENSDDLQEILLQSMCAFLIGICIHFNDDSVPDFTKAKLCRLVKNRIGLEKFRDTLGEITKHEIYSRTLKHPQPYAKTSTDVLLDHEFCKLLKDLEDVVLKTVIEYSSPQQSFKETTLTTPDHELVVQYKDVIRDQDLEIQRLRQLVDNLTKEKHDLELQMQDLKLKNNSLVDQTKILRAAHTGHSNSTLLQSQSLVSESTDNHIEKYKNQIKSLESRLNESLILLEESQKKCTEEDKVLNLQILLEKKTEEFDNLKKDQDDLLILLAMQDAKLTKLKKRLSALNAKVESDDSSSDENTNNQQDNCQDSST